VYRAYQVLNKPLEELASLLGFDIPPVPVIDLASIKADGAIVHWSLPGAEKQRNKKNLKFEIHLNGAIIETVSFHETAVTITGLQPSSFYVVRVALVNEHEFGSRSDPIRFRTKPASSADFFVVGLDGHETDHDGDKETLPRVRLYRGLKDITPAAMQAAPMARETSSSGLGPKRSVTGRRPSPAALGIEIKHDTAVEESEPPEGVETIQQLTEKLDTIRRETDEAETQAKEEEEEEMRLKDELTKERDGLRAEVTEKEKASRNLKREVNTLERQNTAAQNERSKHERMLQQKKQERQKLKQDVARWDRETEELKAAVLRLREERAKHVEESAEQRQSLQAKHAEETSQARCLEDAIKEKNAEIKRLERALKNPSPDNNGEPQPNLVEQMQQDAQEKNRWDNYKRELLTKYAAAAQKLEDARRFQHAQASYLESVRADRRRQEELAAQQQQQQAAQQAQQQQFNSPSPATERLPGLPRRGDSQRSRRAASGHSTSDSPRMGGFPITSASPFANALATVSPFQGAPFLNIQNGMTIAGPPMDNIAMSEEDKEKLTGGAPMSPGAGAELLPADLFSEQGNRTEQLVLPGLGALPGLPSVPGPVGGNSQVALERDAGPASPTSASSRSPSVFASPLASQHNLHIGSPEGVIDADRRSVRSNRSGRAGSSVAQPTSSRFSSMFGIKPRAKTNPAEEGPPLGKAQSHSMPRQDQGIPGLDAATRKRNSSISGVFGPDVLSNDGASDSLAEALGGTSAAPRRTFGMRSIFSKDKEGGWPSSFSGFGRRPGSPRPGSTHSNELPRPSFDSSRWGVDTWPSADASVGARSSPLSFGPGWAAPTGTPSRWAGSRHPSRRPSVQYAASGPPADILEDDGSDVLDPENEPHLAPIGTKPTSASQSMSDKRADNATPKLNPAAKDFKSFFGIKSKDKSATASPAIGPMPAPPSSSNAGTPHMRHFDFDDTESPPNSRKSRDARSMTTTESSLAETASRNSTDLARTPSYSTSEAPSGPSPLIGSVAGSSTTGKESFMAKITRKSSSGKFSLPSFTKRTDKARLDGSSSVASGSPLIPPVPSENEDSGTAGEETLAGSVSSLKEGRESKETNRVGSGRSWSNVLKRSSKASKKGGDAPSVSGQSLASEEGGPADGLGIAGEEEGASV
jgi:hypothetical protein